MSNELREESAAVVGEDWVAQEVAAVRKAAGLPKGASIDEFIRGRAEHLYATNLEFRTAADQQDVAPKVWERERARWAHEVRSQFDGLRAAPEFDADVAVSNADMMGMNSEAWDKLKRTAARDTAKRLNHGAIRQR